MTQDQLQSLIQCLKDCVDLLSEQGDLPEVRVARYLLKEIGEQ